jgi:UDP:flavonoid glycosyltransferase YjiC (YdhE family)
VHGGISRELCLVGTFPQLEYDRSWPPHVRVIGPLLWEPPSEEVDPPPGSQPLVLVAPSTSQDRRQRLLETALEALAGLPVRVLATYNRRDPPRRLTAPPNCRLVEWVSYSRAMPQADLVVCHGGHGTMARALASGVPVVAIPFGGDMAENGARLQWSGAGLTLRERLLRPWTLRSVVSRVLEDPRFAKRAAELGRWAARHDGPTTAARLVERFALGRRDAPRSERGSQQIKPLRRTP